MGIVDKHPGPIKTRSTAKIAMFRTDSLTITATQVFDLGRRNNNQNSVQQDVEKGSAVNFCLCQKHLELKIKTAPMAGHKHLYRRRNPAVMEAHEILQSRAALDLNQRTTQDAPTCASNQKTCPQGGWCCHPDKTCVVNNGFFCCPVGSGQGNAGCRSVCATGDFQCGSICCGSGQTCVQDATLLPYCAQGSGSIINAVSSTLITSVSTLEQKISTATSSLSLSTDDVAADRTSSHLHAARRTPLQSQHQPSATTTDMATIQPSSKPKPPSESKSTVLSSADGDLPKSAQISMGVIVPLFVLLLLASLWFCIFRMNRFFSSSSSSSASPSQSRSRASWAIPTRTGSRLGELDDSFHFPPQPRAAAASSPTSPRPPPSSYMPYPNLKTVDYSTMSMHERYILETSRPIAPPNSTCTRDQPAVKMQTLKRQTTVLTVRNLDDGAEEENEEKVTGAGINTSTIGEK
ncbi:hypothetical protein QBC43DRAFT_360337 [Cladorrhinum sp. PSN259]|nr:hypothetical protein QBC43DRAFT_360337 [Cladorrhinum sp. PSN259]